MIELLVVISIIAVLAALLLPAIALVRSAALSASCASQMRQVGMGLLAYAEENGHILPPSYIQNSDLPSEWQSEPPYNSGGHAMWSHPRLVGTAMADVYDLKVSGGAIVIVGNRSIFRCPADRTTTANRVNVGLSGLASPSIWSPWGSWSSRIPLTRFKGAGTVAILTDTGGDARWDVSAGNVVSGAADAAIGWAPGEVSPTRMIRRHKDGANLLFADGHTGYTRSPRADELVGFYKVAPQ